MRIVVVGAGGREHALVRRFVREGHEVIGVPGNPGIALVARVAKAELADVDYLSRACVRESPDLVVVGPEAPLAAGLADRLRAQGLAVFGPSAAAARIEASKAFAKSVMSRANVPTAAFEVATNERELEAALAKLGGNVAVKADHLASGKGVVVCGSLGEARDAGRRLVAGGPIVVEERLEGPELSVIALTDGAHLAVLPPARDHKRLCDGDLGPNTGGMGAICPAAIDRQTLEFVRDRVLRPVVDELARVGTPFVGALYAGLMLTPQGIRVLEFNARFGDPETQAMLEALDDEVHFAERCLDAATGRLVDAMLPASRAACCVVLASAGYPERPRSGDAIEGLDEAEEQGAIVLHAGTRRENDRLVSSGGRVLGVVASAATLDEARATANEAASKIRLAGAQRRTDIGATST